jgi:hypothetical protein
VQVPAQSHRESVRENDRDTFDQIETLLFVQTPLRLHSTFFLKQRCSQGSTPKADAGACLH